MKTQSKWLWILGIGALAGLAIWKLTKKVSAAPVVKTVLTTNTQNSIAAIQASIASTTVTLLPASQIGTTADPNADANAQAIYTVLANITPVSAPIAANGMTASELLNIHALVPTPEQTAAGAVPLASAIPLSTSNIYGGGPVPTPEQQAATNAANAAYAELIRKYNIDLSGLG